MNEPSLFWKRAAGLAFLLAVLGVWFWLESTPAPRVAPPAGQAVSIDKSPKAQGERKALMDELVAKGLVRRIDSERGGAPRVSLRAAFYELDDAARTKYIEAVYGYYFDGSSVNDVVFLRDARHGNEIGQYNPYRGGLKMYK